MVDREKQARCRTRFGPLRSYPAQGECACYNFSVDASGSRVAVQGAGLVSHDGSQQGMVRHDMYCVADGPNTKNLSADDQSKYCGSGGNPLTPTPQMPAGLPPHCWLSDCQGNKDTCLFYDPRTMNQKCPDVCLQVSAGNTIRVGTVTNQPSFAIAGNVQECQMSDTDKKPLGKCFAVDDPKFDLQYQESLSPGQKISAF